MRPLLSRERPARLRLRSAAAQATRTIALVGDSHASHWRGPLGAVARARGWRGRSIARTSCPFSTATKHTPQPTRSRCERWVRKVPAYFRAHPEIDTVFVVAITGGAVNVPRGRTMLEAKVNGYRSAWEKLLDRVERIVVIRDAPRISNRTVECIERAIDDRRAAGETCAVAREDSREVDPQALAARGAQGRAVRVVALTPVFCDSRLCLPVIGGALVFKDLHHLTLVFADTLAPALGRAIDRAMGPSSIGPRSAAVR